MSTKRKRTAVDRRLQSAIDEISRNHSTKLRLPELTSKVGLSVRRLEQLFVEETGMSYIAYRRRLRMQLAQRLLKGSGAEVRQITSAVGYKASAFFCREFKKAKGCTTTKFRARLAKEKTDIR